MCANMCGSQRSALVFSLSALCLIIIIIINFWLRRGLSLNPKLINSAMLVSHLSAFLPSAGTKDEQCLFRFYVASEDLNSGLHSRITSILPTEPSPLLLMESSLTFLPSQSTVDLNQEYCLHFEAEGTKIQAEARDQRSPWYQLLWVGRVKACTQRRSCPHTQKLWALPHMQTRFPTYDSGKESEMEDGLEFSMGPM